MQLLLLVFAIILILFSGLFYTRNYAKKTIRENTLALNQKILLQIEGQVEEYGDTIQKVATTVAYSPTITSYYMQSQEERILSAENVSMVFSNAVLMNEDIEGIYLYDMSCREIAATGQIIEAEELQTDHKKEMEYGSIFYFFQGGEPYYKIYFPIYDLDDKQFRKQIGTCIFLMGCRTYSDFLVNSQATDSAEVYLLDRDDQIISSIGADGGQTLEKDDMQSNEVYYVTTQQLKTGDWKIVSRIPKAEMEQNISGNTHLTVMAYLLALLLVFILVTFFYWHVLHRLFKINAFVKNTVSDPQLRLEHIHEDEVGVLAKNFNLMLDEKEEINQKMIESQSRMYEMELAKRKLQVLAYKNQINPHFLYNTFECIRALAIYHDTEDIAEIMSALSNIFRFAVKGENIVTVEKELDYIEEYATIIDYRFRGKIAVRIDAEDEVLEQKMIKLMLQPLVENAVVHGLERQISGGTVRVYVHTYHKDHMQFVISDNGCGMEVEKLESIKETLHNEENSKGIGISNIYQRLKLFYGEDVVFHITSQAGKGTEIEIIIPMQVEEQKENV